MIRLNPLSLQVDSADRYRLRCESEKGIEQFTFSFDRENGMITSDQREFYVATYDDDDTDFLNGALVRFDRAVQASAHNELTPYSINVADTGYEVQFEGNNGMTAYLFSMKDGAAVAPEQQIGLVSNETTIKQLSDAITAFHRARKLTSFPS